MFAYMNKEAMQLTITSGLAHYWSRSRESLWKKGETSGMFQKVTSLKYHKNLVSISSLLNIA